MEKTENYQLNQWDAADPIRREDFNADNAKLDAALAAIQQTAEGKADAEDVAALNETVATVAAGLGSGGQNARVACGSYAGDGTYGSTAPTTVITGFTPVLVIVHDEVNIKTYNPAIFLREFTVGRNNKNDMINLIWSDTALSWYYENAGALSPAGIQMNAAGQVYQYIALGYSAS